MYSAKYVSIIMVLRPQVHIGPMPEAYTEDGCEFCLQLYCKTLRVLNHILQTVAASQAYTYTLECFEF
jgi:hypothetical protein